LSSARCSSPEEGIRSCFLGAKVTGEREKLREGGKVCLFWFSEGGKLQEGGKMLWRKENEGTQQRKVTAMSGTGCLFQQ
jgi:hypothetical protein